MGYVGMDTVNMHMAAALGKRVFAVFGPTKPFQWAPWSNALQSHAHESKPVQTYGKITLFQADIPCVPCGLAGCDDNDGIAECLYQIPPERIFAEIDDWITNATRETRELSR
jgi:heptosyltransferase-3